MPVSCYLCGRDFGSRSIAIHVPNCAKKWEDEQRKVPKSLRQPPPRAPDNLDRVMEGKLEGEELRQFNMDAVKMWNEAVLVTCQHCKRYISWLLFFITKSLNGIYRGLYANTGK